MTKRFNFENDVNLDIAGVKFSFDSTDLDLLKTLEKFGQESQDIAKEVLKKTDYIEGLKEVIQFNLDAIDKILGEGASNKIFEGQKASLNNTTGVLSYISEEVSLARKRQMDKYAPERASRKNKL